MKFTRPIPSCSIENFCFHLGDYSFGFNGKDKESEFNSGAYDFGARIHDARLGRWMSVDPKTRIFTSISGYTFGADSPLKVTDCDGNIICGDVNQFIADVASVLCKIEGADIFVSMLEANADNNQIAQISEADFKLALEALREKPEAAALINGLYQAVISTNIYQIEYVSDDENLAKLVPEENDPNREWLLGKTGFDLKKGIASNYDKSQSGETSKAIIGFTIAKLKKSDPAKFYCIVNRDAVGSQLLFPAIGGNDKTVNGQAEFSILNMMFVGFFENDAYIKNYKGQNTKPRIAGFLVENIARDYCDAPLVSNNGVALSFNIPPELEVNFPKQKQRSSRNSKQNPPKSHAPKHANPRFL